jgi:hypothetical protein
MGRDTNSQMEESMGTASHRPRRRARLQISTAALAVGAAATAVALVPGAAGARSTAHAARTMNIKESASLHLNNKHGLVLKESGTAKGTLSGPLYLQLTVTSTRSVTATVQVYPGGGSLSGKASANYRVNGATASFSGSLNITGGGGRYSKAKGSGLSFSGTIRRSNDAVTVYVSGKLSY